MSTIYFKGLSFDWYFNWHGDFHSIPMCLIMVTHRLNEPSFSFPLNGNLKEKCRPGLVSFNPCVFRKTHIGGILLYGQDVEHLSFELHSWFKISSWKREDFMKVVVEIQNGMIFSCFEKSETLFYWQVESRWLALIPA